MKWPFKDMQAGEVLVLWGVNPAQAAMSAHNVGRYKGWKFKTEKVDSPDGRVGIRVERLAVPDADWVSRTPKGSRMVTYGYEQLEVGEEVTLRGESEFLSKALAGVQARERKFGIKIQRKTATNPLLGVYSSVTFKRVA